MTLDFRKSRHPWSGAIKSLAVGLLVFYLGREMAVWLTARNVHGFLAFLDNILAGIAAGLVVFLFERRRQRAVDTLRESEHRFRLVANAAPALIWMSGTDKLCTYFNEPWLNFSGRLLEQELGNGWVQGVHPDDVKQCLDTYTQSFDRREKFSMEYRLRDRDGEYRYILDIGVPRFNEDGSFAGYIGIAVDVTERKKAENVLANYRRQLIDAQEEERSRIARELHDDINQRVALITISLQRCGQRLSDHDADILDSIRDLCEKLSNLGKDVQALSHRLHSSKLDYLGLALAARSLCKEISDQHKVEIDFSATGIPHGLDKRLSLCLFRVLQEALQNAVKYSGVGQFTVKLHAESGKVELVVSDRGVGFDPQDAIKQCGMGLVSMRERMQSVGGELSIHSQPDAGTTVKACAPCTVEVGESEAMKAAG